MKLKRVIVLSLLLLFSVGGLALGGETLARARDSRDKIEVAANPNAAQPSRRRGRRRQRRERRRHRRHRRHNM